MYSCRIYGSVAHEQTRVFQSQPVFEADIASDARGQTGGTIEGELDDGYACVGQGFDMELDL